MVAVIADEMGAPALRTAVRRLREDFKLPADRVMSWKQHVKTHDRRKRAVEVLSALEGVRVCYVYSVKSALRAGSYRDHPQRHYNDVAFQLYKMVLWAARSWKGAGAQVWTRFGHVKGHDHTSTETYLRREASKNPKVPHEMEQGLKWVSADKYRESQAADLYGGFLKAALWPDGEFDYTEPSYLLGVWHQLVNSHRCAVPLGIMSMPENDLVRQNAWFPCHPCPPH
jgi:hypothetical protein